MTTIKDAYINALLSDASYVDLIDGPLDSGSNKTALNGRLTQSQADYLAANFEMVGSPCKTSDNPLEGGSGFDAVEWRIEANTELLGSGLVMRHFPPPLQRRLAH